MSGIIKIKFESRKMNIVGMLTNFVMGTRKKDLIMNIFID